MDVLQSVSLAHGALWEDHGIGDSMTCLGQLINSEEKLFWMQNLAVRPTASPVVHCERTVTVTPDFCVCVCVCVCV